MKSMRNFWLIAKREYLATVKTKAFILGLILAPVLMGGSVIGMALLHDKVDTTDRHIAIIDHTGVVAHYLLEAAEKRNENEVFEDGVKKRPLYLFDLVEAIPDDHAEMRLHYSNLVRNNEYFGFVEIGPEVLASESVEGLSGSISFYSRNPTMDDLRGWLTHQVNLRIREWHLLNLGMDPESLGDIFRWQRVEGMELVEADISGRAKEAKRVNEAIAIGVPLLLTLFMFLLIMMGAMPLLSSVMEEKNQHIAETLLSSVTPFQFMFGKVMGGVAISLTASAIYVLGSLLFLAQMGLFGWVLLHLIPWFLIYLVLAILMLGSIMASIGAACNDLRESQNLTVPAMLPIMIPLFVLMPVLKEPMSGFATTLSLIPPFTPILMLMRQSVPGGVPEWQVAIGLIGLVVFTLICIWGASRIFRVGILIKGKTPGFPTLIKWAIKG